MTVLGNAIRWCCNLPVEALDVIALHGKFVRTCGSFSPIVQLTDNRIVQVVVAVKAIIFTAGV